MNKINEQREKQAFDAYQKAIARANRTYDVMCDMANKLHATARAQRRENVKRAKKALKKAEAEIIRKAFEEALAEQKGKRT
jgi:hypothetical protein